MWTLLISCLINSFLDIVQKIKNRFFKNYKSPSRFCILISNGAQNFKSLGIWFSNLFPLFLRKCTFKPYFFPEPTKYWLNFIRFLEYKYKIRLVSILRKRKDQALISKSTILKFPAQFSSHFFPGKSIYKSKTRFRDAWFVFH